MLGVGLNNLEKIKEIVTLYNNGTLYFAVFVIMLIILLIIEKDKGKRLILGILPVILAAVYVCPLYSRIGMKIEGDIYYRVIWSLPICAICCYTAIRLMAKVKKKLAKGVCFAAAVFVIMAGGKLVYRNTLYFRSVNAYHMPQVVINVADALRLENYKANAAMPAELLPFFHQYSADTLTPYGRNILEPGWKIFNFKSELYDAMESDPDRYDAKEVARCARNDMCAFVVLSSVKEIVGSMEEENYFLLGFVDGYYIYMDYNYYWVLKEQNLLNDAIIAVGG